MTDALALFQPQTARWFQETVGMPTPVQQEGWPAIATGGHVLVSAPTGSGKTLAAFLVFVDRLQQLAREGKLAEETYLIYISPLKALGNDIRENLRRPLEGIEGPALNVAIRTGDTTSAERRRMIKHPPHILITTPESLYLLLTSQSGQGILKQARAVIIDELHAVINGKRGAHLMLSLARLDKLCGRNLQRIGLSATIEPLERAADYLAAPDAVQIVAPQMFKGLDIEVNSPLADMRVLPEGTIWPELAKQVYHYSADARTVIVFVEARNQAERLSYYINQLAGEGYSRTHHGCIAKGKRLEAEQQLRSGKLRVLCATSSMELGIDVGEVDLVLQIGYPRTVSSAMQRLGRAGHNPGRVSVMRMLPRTAAETVYCGFTARLALAGRIEPCEPPHKCLDVLAQHLVSMATPEGYTVDEALALLQRTYCFRDVSRAELENVLCMLAGDYEHALDRPVRPRLLYDRIHGCVEGDNYSRLLALSTGGTIPDRGLYAVRLADGTKVGELDEEFVFEARIGDKFMLGSFAWRIAGLERDKVLVDPATPEGAQPPFWKGEQTGRSFETGKAFGQMLSELTQAHYQERLDEALQSFKMDEAAVFNAGHFIRRQLDATGLLPDDRNLLIEHFRDQAGESQIMVHSVFGRRVNACLALLVKELAERETGMDISCYDDDDGFLVFPYGGGKPLPEGLLQRIKPEEARAKLLAMLPATPLFNMAFRYNAGRALMMGMRQGQRQPLWVQRLKGAEVLDGAIRQQGHPLVAETRRECLENYWDLGAVEEVLQQIQAGQIAVRELYLPEPSPMSLPYRRQAESVLLYDYTPTTSAVLQAAEVELTAANTVKPLPEHLEQAAARRREPENAAQLHTVLITEGDLLAGEIDAPLAWFETLVEQGRACYIEPGLWICREQLEQYEAALLADDGEQQRQIVRRCLRYRGAQDAHTLSARYFWPPEQSQVLLDALIEAGSAVESGGWYYHTDLYNRAQRETITARRRAAQTLPPACYALLRSRRLLFPAEPQEQLRQAVKSLANLPFAPAYWEEVLLPARVNGYRENMLDSLLAQGEWFWQFTNEEKPLLSFHRYEDIDWQQEIQSNLPLTEDEQAILAALRQRGASFGHSLSSVIEHSAAEVLLGLSGKGLVHADSFAPVRQWLNQEKTKKAQPRQRARARAMTVSGGRWELAHPLRQLTLEIALEQAFDQALILCRETSGGLNWTQALELLRIWEYQGIVRRGYFIQGLSGAQFIRETDYAAVMAGVEPQEGIVWLNAADPAQVWGKALPHQEQQSFMNVSSTAVALQNGQPVAVLERSGKVLRVFRADLLPEIATTLAAAYRRKQIYAPLKRITVKEYPPEAAEALQQAGFSRQMMDYVLWQSS